MTFDDWVKSLPSRLREQMLRVLQEACEDAAPKLIHSLDERIKTLGERVGHSKKRNQAWGDSIAEINGLLEPLESAIRKDKAEPELHLLHQFLARRKADLSDLIDNSNLEELQHKCLRLIQLRDKLRQRGRTATAVLRKVGP